MYVQCLRQSQNESRPPLILLRANDACKKCHGITWLSTKHNVLQICSPITISAATSFSAKLCVRRIDFTKNTTTTFVHLLRILFRINEALEKKGFKHFPKKCFTKAQCVTDNTVYTDSCTRVATFAH